MAEFNLIERPWIPVTMRDGTAENVELGLLATLLRAHEVAEVYDPSPLVTASLHRLLLAVLHRSLDGPPDEEAWCALWSRGRFEEAPLKTYLKKWAHRFDLFHPERPFYQTTEVKDAKASPISRLMQEAAAGNNATLFDHSVDESPTPVSPAQAARLVVATQAFAVGSGPPSNPFFDSTLTKGINFLAMGGTLFETLLLNLMPVTPERPVPRLEEEDPPCWEQDVASTPGLGGNPIRGYLDLLTWQSRRLFLAPEGNGSVRWVVVSQGPRLQADRDPFKHYRMDEKLGVQPIRFSPEKALWRDIHTLFSSAGDQDKPCKILDWQSKVSRLAKRNRIQLDVQPRLSAFGQATGRQAADIILWRHERLPLPLGYLETEREMLRARLKQALAIAEEAKEALRKGAWRLSCVYLLPLHDGGSLSKGQMTDVRNLIDGLAPQRVFWSRLEVPFRNLLLRLPAEVSEDGPIDILPPAFPPWAKEVRRACTEAFESAVTQMGSDAKALKAAARARPEFHLALAAAMKPFRKEEEAHG